MLEKTIDKKEKYTKALWFHMKSIQPSDNIKLTKLVNEERRKKKRVNKMKL